MADIAHHYTLLYDEVQRLRNFVKELRQFDPLCECGDEDCISCKAQQLLDHSLSKLR